MSSKITRTRQLRLGVMVGIVCVISLSTISAQAVVHQILDANLISVALQSDGTLFKTEERYGYFLSPNEGGDGPASTAFIGNLWLAGLDQGLNLHVSTSLYGNGFNPYTYGMLNSGSGTLSTEPMMSQNRVWKITRQDVLNQLISINAGGILPISQDIIDWPARGNTAYGGLLEDRDGAPFFDGNNDGIYNPYQGDYPNIDFANETKVPNQILLSVSNDNPIDFFESLQVEMYTLLYAFKCEDDEALNRSVFQKQIIYSRGDLSYHGLRIGYFIDLEVGCGGDDYVGCDTLQNAFYSYNKDFDDGIDVQCVEGAVLFTNAPVHITKVLNRKMDSFMQWSNGMFEPVFNDILSFDSPLDFYSLLGGVWPNGIPLTFGGNGYNEESTDTTRFAFPGNPNDPNSWSMYNEQIGKADPKVLASHFIDTFSNAEPIVLELVHTVTQSDQHNFRETVDLALSESARVEAFYHSGFSSDCEQVLPSNVNESLPSIELLASPNPTAHSVQIITHAILRSYRLLDMNGAEIQFGNLNSNHSIEFNEVPSGLYLLEIQLASFQLYFERILIAK